MSKADPVVRLLLVIFAAGIMALAAGLAVTECLNKREAESTQFGYCRRFIDWEAGVVIYWFGDSLAVIPLAETNLD